MSAPVSSQSSLMIQMEFGVLLRHGGLMNCILILRCLMKVQGRDNYFGDLIKNNKTKQTKQRQKRRKKMKTRERRKKMERKNKKPASRLVFVWASQLGMTIGTTASWFLCQFECWPSLKFTAVWESLKLCSYFLAKFSVRLDDILYAATTCIVSLQPKLNLLCMFDIQGRESHTYVIL